MSNVVPSLDTGPSAGRIVAVIGIIVAAFVLIGIFVPVPGAGGKADVPSLSQMTTEAKAQCREAVKDQLKSPASAKFSDETVTGSEPDAVWFVSGSVDSQNSYGALLRSSFECSVTFANGEASAVRVTSLG